MGDYKIYCDLDGVLIDFNKGYKDLTGHDLDGEHRNDTNFWDPINNAGYDFWINLEWIKPDGHTLWDFIKPLIDQVLIRGEATWHEDQLLPIYRNGKKSRGRVYATTKPAIS